MCWQQITLHMNCEEQRLHQIFWGESEREVGYIKQVFQNQITPKIQAQGGSNTGHHLLLLTCASPSNLQLYITASSSVCFFLAEEKNKNKEQ